MHSLALGWLLAACSSSAPPTAPPSAPNLPPEAVPADVEVVAGHTLGLISRADPIVVRFVDPVVEEGAVGAELPSSPVRMTPDVVGVASFTTPQLLTFVPDAPLASGATFTVSVDMGAVRPEWDGRDFSFPVAVVPQGIHLEEAGLSADGAEKQRYEAVIRTDDVALATDVERLVSVAYAPMPAMTWSHTEDALQHRLTLSGIARQEHDATLTLTVDGTPLGVAETLEKTVRIPGLNHFELVSVRPVLDGSRHVELRFSDPVEPKQDLAGLVRIEGIPDVRHEVDGSIVRLYVEHPFDGGTVVVSGLKNSRGYRISEEVREPVRFATQHPAVRFASDGVIFPTTHGVTVPIETMNLESVVIEAVRVYESNVPQFLQANRDLGGTSEIERVGRVVWRSRVPITNASDAKNRWMRVGLDLGRLLKEDRRGLYRLRLGFTRADVDYPCEGPAAKMEPIPPVSADDWERRDGWETTSWDTSWGMAISGFGYDAYQSRNDPCSDAFYQPLYDHDVRVDKNVLLSNLGLVAKVGNDGSLLVATTDLRTASPRAGVEVRVVDYPLQTLARATTDEQGFARIRLPSEKPFAVAATLGDDAAWVRLDSGSSLTVSHFDVAGDKVQDGLKGFVYGERGVWRPGDDIFLTFVLNDESSAIPDDYPVSFELTNPLGQRVDARTLTSGMGGFYRLQTKTAYDAPTGNYVARVRAGGATFTETLKVETIKPNRLKIDLGTGDEVLAAGVVDATLESRWLHGAKANGLRAEVDLRLSPRATSFAQFPEYSFDDPTARFASDTQQVFSGDLDDEGRAALHAPIVVGSRAGGLLTGTFETRVFEPGGGFSVEQHSAIVSPHRRYLGVKLPKGDKARGMLLTDIQHPVDIVAVDARGKPTGDGEVELAVYEVHWRWWWDQGPDDLASYAGNTSYQSVAKGRVKLTDGKGQWHFEVKYPQWGRYLIVAKDLDGTHTTGRTMYIDWPGWAGRAQKDNPGGANVLSVVADPTSGAVGQEIAVTFPAAPGSRALVTLENGSGILDAQWVEAAEGDTTTWRFPARPEMAPNVYAHVTLLQPHESGNDLPIRMYGIAPITVSHPESKLEPKLATADVFEPRGTARITVSEEHGRPMTYTLAVVDEGLLGLTRFRTPDPWKHFYRKEALGVRTWDVFHEVAGAYGASLDALLAIGGGDEGSDLGTARANRFDPVVAYFGPFRLDSASSRTHEVEIPNYVGEVRVMVVAGHEGAYGSVERSIPVKKPLVALATVPRVLAPGDELAIPVSVFALEDQVKSASVELSVEGPVEVQGTSRRELTFARMGDQTTAFHVKVGATPGIARITVVASDDRHRVEETTEVDVRVPTRRQTRVVAERIAPGARVTLPVLAFGSDSEPVLEVSMAPPLNLSSRLDYLVSYPHGCLEQTTSSAFPQLYLPELTKMDAAKSAEVSAHVNQAIERLGAFQTGTGGYGYAVGGYAFWPALTEPDEWTTSYVGHFNLEAERAGFHVPADRKSAWITYQRDAARRWTATEDALVQAYRLYTLALAGSPSFGDMNRLRTLPLPDDAAWRLAAAYQLVGQADAAAELVQGRSIEPHTRDNPETFADVLRDQALILDTLVLMGDPRADVVAAGVSDHLASDEAYSTHATAWALVAMSHYVAAQPAGSWSVRWSAGGVAHDEAVDERIREIRIPAGSVTVENPNGRAVFVEVVTSGVPEVGAEDAEARGVSLSVQYARPDGTPVDPSRLSQGTDLVATVTVHNEGRKALYDLASSLVLPSGWELHGIEAGPGVDFTYRDVRDDRVSTYFDLKGGETRTFTVPLHAAYLGHFYLPAVQVEHMYDAGIYARSAGRWVDVTSGEES